jgi:DNA-binding winged helix-turn-helix (wHTH) protein
LPNRAGRVSFGPFTLDGATHLLLRDPGRQPVHLTPKAYELLWVLVEERPKALSKTELHERLWPSTFVSEATLASLVGELRDALGERGREARYVRTVHGFGYAFAAEAREREASVQLPSSWIVCNGREYPLHDGESVIGREPDAAITLSSPTVSRHHARLMVAAGVATIEDLGSKNGTSVRGRPIASPMVLADGDRIRIGAFELTFRTLSVTGSTETLA